ncbi:hypothetical protein [Mesorhizobium sp. M0578]|uniref:hypothetical protein n=1 Tax=unclassified Mesorhizobium TaxID=325217 RepID=UPI003338E4ED
MEAKDCHEYLGTCAAQEVVLVNPRISLWILSDKAILAVLSDDRFSPNFNAEQIELISRLGQHQGGSSLLFANEPVSEEEILAGHFQSNTRSRCVAEESPILVLQDTTEFTYQEAAGADRRHAFAQLRQ